MLSPKSDSKTLGNMEVLSTYVLHPCDSWELDTQLVGYTTIYVKAIVLDLVAPLTKNKSIINVTTLTLSSQPKQRHGKGVGCGYNLEVTFSLPGV